MGTPTTNKGYTVPTLNGDFGSWGNEVNANYAIQDLNLGGTLAVNAAGNSDITVSAANSQYLKHNLTGILTGNIQYILPAVGGMYLIKNATTGSYTVTATCAGGGSTVLVPQGTSMIVVTDGTNAEAATTAMPSLMVSSGGAAITGASTVTGALTVSTPGTSGNQVVNFSQFNPNAGFAGYVRFPGGVTMQWGNSTGPSVNITFPVAFSGTPWNIQAILKDAPSGGTTGYAQITNTYSSTGFTAVTISSASNGITANFFWFAVGPT